MKKVIGVAPFAFMGDPQLSCMEDHYKLNNNYVKRVAQSGCTPLCLAPVDNWLTKEQLDMCDGFVVQGGSTYFPYHFQIIHHAVTTGKPYLGICLGEQLIYTYFKLKKIVEQQGYTGDLVKAICDYRKKTGGVSVLARAEGHRCEKPPRGQEDSVKHDINVVKNTLLHKVLGVDSCKISTFHKSCVPADQTLVKVNAWSTDGIVEGVEYSNNVLGIQGHPEIDDKLPQFFEFLAKF